MYLSGRGQMDGRSRSRFILHIHCEASHNKPLPPLMLSIELGGKEPPFSTSTCVDERCSLHNIRRRIFEIVEDQLRQG